VKVTRAVRKGQSLTWSDVAMDETTHAYRVRREMEAMFGERLLEAA
jgi:predicted homoserine dehydrogenase-like protein